MTAKQTQLDLAIEAGRKAGEELAKTPLSPHQRAMLQSVLAPALKVNGR